MVFIDFLSPDALVVVGAAATLKQHVRKVIYVRLNGHTCKYSNGHRMVLVEGES